MKWKDSQNPPSVPLSTAAPTGIYVRALYDYEAKDETGLSFRQGDMIQVVTQMANGWWDGDIHGTRGWFPSNHCKVVSDPGPHTMPSEPPPAMKKHKCSYCSAEFTRYHNLKSHFLTHTHERPHICDYPKCGAGFRHRHDLYRHSRLHAGESAYDCLKCDRSFAGEDALARHMEGPNCFAGHRSTTESLGSDDENGDTQTTRWGDDKTSLLC